MGTEHLNLPEVIIATIGAVTFVWHVGMYAGILINRMHRLEDRADVHEKRLDDHDNLIGERRAHR